MRVAWSCVLDDTPSIWASVTPWLRTAMECAGIPPDQLFVHHVCPLRPDIAETCKSLGVNTRLVEAFNSDFPHTNKIPPFMTDFGDVDHVVFTDVDTVFSALPPFDEIRHPVSAKPVDLPNPPLETLSLIFTAANLPVPDEWEVHYWNEQAERIMFPTFSANYNGGMYVIERQHLTDLGQAWSKWSHWLIDRIELVKSWCFHLDQISFCMAVHELQLPHARLDDAWNFPLHLQADQEGREPFILHHHADFSGGFHLPPNDAERTKKAVARVNQVMAKASAHTRHG